MQRELNTVEELAAKDEEISELREKLINLEEQCRLKDIAINDLLARLQQINEISEYPATKTITTMEDARQGRR